MGIGLPDYYMAGGFGMAVVETIAVCFSNTPDITNINVNTFQCGKLNGYLYLLYIMKGFNYNL